MRFCFRGRSIAPQLPDRDACERSAGATSPTRNCACPHESAVDPQSNIETVRGEQYDGGDPVVVQRQQNEKNNDEEASEERLLRS